jgi:hypothetical protein
VGKRSRRSALPLKLYRRLGRFPRGRGGLHDDAVEFVARRLGVGAESLGFTESGTFWGRLRRGRHGVRRPVEAGASPSHRRAGATSPDLSRSPSTPETGSRQAGPVLGLAPH